MKIIQCNLVQCLDTKSLDYLICQFRSHFLAITIYCRVYVCFSFFFRIYHLKLGINLYLKLTYLQDLK